MIRFLCTNCGKTMRARPEQAGSTGRCPRCRRAVEVPRDSTPGGSSRPSDGRPLADPDAPETDFLAPPQAPGELGRLGDFRVLRVLGAGAMGVVFEAEDTKLHRKVALKVMKKAIARNPEDRQRFLQEARATAAIEHDHIVTIYRVDEDRGVPYLAMKLLVGETLEERLNREAPLPADEVIRIGREIAQGLAEAHERGLIHRDIKPANIWLEEGSGRVKILDFGLARVADDPDAEEEERNMLIGTPLYMSPEQARGGDIDARADLFSLGAVLYRATTGELPFKGRTAKAVVISVLRDVPKSPREVNRTVPPYLSRMIVDLLEKTRDDRPMNARNVIVMFGMALERIDEVPPEDREPVEAVEEDEPETRRPKPRKPRRKGESEYTLEGKVIWWSVFACVGVVVLLVLLHVVRTFLKREDPPPPVTWVWPAPRGSERS